MQRTRLAGVALAVGMLAVPSVAAAATREVYMGVPPASQKPFEKAQADANAFFPTTQTIHVGDSVRFIPVGFHTVDLPNRGGDPLPLIAPAGSVSNAVDAAGAAFWFNGQPSPAFNPQLAKSGFGKRFTYTGSKRVLSGLPREEKPKPMTVRFKKTGSFRYFCNLHPGMDGTVRVVRSSRRIPSQAAGERQVKRQARRATAVVKTRPSVKPPANTVNLGVAGSGGVESFVFSPANLTVSRGTTVTFRMTPGTREVHTATSGPGDPESQPTSYLGTLAASLESPVFNPAAFYPSDAPGSVVSLTPTTHGNGFWNSGFLDGVRASPVPNAAPVRFDTPGTYTFYCLVHPFMMGTVTVQ